MVVSANRTFRYSPLFLNWIVFVCGFAVMIVELLGTRIIAPFYGTSLYVWSALISVTLVSLSIGYYFGGRLADRMGGNLLPASIAIAGVFVLIVPMSDFIGNNLPSGYQTRCSGFQRYRIKLWKDLFH